MDGQTQCVCFTCYDFRPLPSSDSVRERVLLNITVLRGVTPCSMICSVASQEIFTSTFMAVSRAVIKTLSDIRDFRGFLRKQHGAIFRRTCLNGKITLRVRSGAAFNEDGVRIAGGRWGDLSAESRDTCRSADEARRASSLWWIRR
jgi:hypothetical protein